MITLALPWLLLVFPLPFLLRAWLAPHREPRPSLHVPFLDRLSRITGRQPGEGASILEGVMCRKLVMPLVWLSLVVALARPRWVELPVSKVMPTRDLMVAVDLSGSMETRDFTDSAGRTVDRLTAVKQVLDTFLAGRQGDRVGLIFFGTAPFVQAPFTTDLGACRQLLREAQVKMAGPQTAFGDAIGLSINLFDRSPMRQKVLIVLTDGNDTASQVPPATAARIAKGKGIVIHTISVGDPRAAGEESLDVPTLQAVAGETGGVYSAASDRRQLEQIYQKLDGLETLSSRTVSHRPRRDVHHWPVAAALILSVVYQTSLLGWRFFRHRTLGESMILAQEIPGSP